MGWIDLLIINLKKITWLYELSILLQNHLFPRHLWRSKIKNLCDIGFFVNSQNIKWKFKEWNKNKSTVKFTRILADYELIKWKIEYFMVYLMLYQNSIASLLAWKPTSLNLLENKSLHYTINKKRKRELLKLIILTISYNRLLPLINLLSKNDPIPSLLAKLLLVLWHQQLYS